MTKTEEGPETRPWYYQNLSFWSIISWSIQVAACRVVLHASMSALISLVWDPVWKPKRLGFTMQRISPPLKVPVVISSRDLSRISLSPLEAGLRTRRGRLTSLSGHDADLLGLHHLGHHIFIARLFILLLPLPMTGCPLMNFGCLKRNLVMFSSHLFCCLQLKTWEAEVVLL